ncbi:Hypothetical protein GL50581_4 [Giardia duodenalis ATCC 50581]|uniref:Uncharacterized protein n=2 Tax=Giardia intestinalis TaxID=5741 RepID=C6LMQ9_GIAIB|nr:Hypothetical protein GL50581_4 [Giardia intestinalis ATCC 50581]
MNMLTDIKVGGIPTCIKCFVSAVDLKRHLLGTEHSTLEWHQMNRKSICPFCSKTLRTHRAVQNHCNTDIKCRSLLRQKIGFEEETNILFSAHRANLLRSGHETPLIEPNTRAARQEEAARATPPPNVSGLPPPLQVKGGGFGTYASGPG